MPTVLMRASTCSPRRRRPRARPRCAPASPPPPPAALCTPPRTAVVATVSLVVSDGDEEGGARHARRRRNSVRRRSELFLHGRRRPHLPPPSRHAPGVCGGTTAFFPFAVVVPFDDGKDEGEDKDEEEDEVGSLAPPVEAPPVDRQCTPPSTRAPPSSPLSQSSKKNSKRSGRRPRDPRGLAAWRGPGPSPLRARRRRRRRRRWRKRRRGRRRRALPPGRAARSAYAEATALCDGATEDATRRRSTLLAPSTRRVEEASPVPRRRAVGWRRRRCRAQRQRGWGAAVAAASGINLAGGLAAAFDPAQHGIVSVMGASFPQTMNYSLGEPWAHQRSAV